ncbi:MAG: DinB family protein [Sediminibacterium sp.]
MKNYLIDTFKFNDTKNRELLEKIKLLGDKFESIRLFSHLINCQYKWFARMSGDPNAKLMSWWEPIYEEQNLDSEWTKSLDIWLQFIQSLTQKELSTERTFIGFDDSLWAATPQDVALQLNYHSIHHRAQIQMLLRQQGVEPDFIDYIGTKYRKLHK